MKELGGVGKAGAIAEEAILGVRTVQAFNGQEVMVQRSNRRSIFIYSFRYEEQLSAGKRFAVEKSFWSGFFGGLFFFLLYAFFAAGFLLVQILWEFLFFSALAVTFLSFTL